MGNQVSASTSFTRNPRQFPLKTEVFDRTSSDSLDCIVDESICDFCSRFCEQMATQNGKTRDSRWQWQTCGKDSRERHYLWIFRPSSLISQVALAKKECAMCLRMKIFQNVTGVDQVLLAHGPLLSRYLGTDLDFDYSQVLPGLNDLDQYVLNSHDDHWRSCFYMSGMNKINGVPVPGNNFMRYEFLIASDEESCLQLPLRGCDMTEAIVQGFVCTQSSFGSLMYPSPTSKSEKCFAQVREWYQECTGHHDKCVRRKLPLPSRLLRIEDEGSGPGRVYVVDTRKYSSRLNDAQYVALSYCWGGIRAFSTNTTNLSTRIDHGIPFTDLPLVVQDAVLVTSKVGLRFIWVDAMCILQDSVEDWTHEANKMSEVYEGCVFTISALAGETSMTNFLGDRGLRPIYLGRVKIEDGSRACSSRLFARRVPRSGRTELSRGALSTRAWPLQERVLSPAILHYGRDQMIWECNKHLRSEVGERLNSPLMLPRISAITPTQNAPLDIWCSYVMEFTGRNIAFVSDRLPAILGIASKLRSAGLYKGRYVAGHWESGLHSSLLWYRHQDSLYGPMTETNIQVPTWSWAHRNYKVCLKMHGNTVCALSKAPRFVIKNPQIERQSQGSSTTVPCCAIEIGGYLQTVGKIWTSTNIKPELTSDLCRWVFDSLSPPTATCYCLRLVGNFARGYLREYVEYLILNKVDDNKKLVNSKGRSNVYVRVGYLSLCRMPEQHYEKPYPDVVSEDGEPILYDGRWEDILLI